MKKVLVAKFIFLFVLLVTAIPQNSSWYTMSVPGICSISIPPSLEIQSGNYKEFMNAYTEKYFDDPFLQSRLIAQPIGKNIFDKEALKKYCNVILEVYRGNAGDFLCFGIDVSMSDEEEKVVNDATINKLIEETKKLAALGLNIKLLSIEPVKIKKVQNFPTVESTYVRMVNNESPVKVVAFMIHNNDILVHLEVCYRLSEKDVWENDLSRVISTFTMTKR